MLRRGAEDVAIKFRCVGLARCFASCFVGAPVASLAILAAVVCGSASATFASTRF